MLCRDGRECVWVVTGMAVPCSCGTQDWVCRASASELGLAASVWLDGSMHVLWAEE